MRRSGVDCQINQINNHNKKENSGAPEDLTGLGTKDDPKMFPLVSKKQRDLPTKREKDHSLEEISEGMMVMKEDPILEEDMMAHPVKGRKGKKDRKGSKDLTIEDRIEILRVGKDKIDLIIVDGTKVIRKARARTGLSIEDGTKDLKGLSNRKAVIVPKVTDLIIEDHMKIEETDHQDLITDGPMEEMTVKAHPCNRERVAPLWKDKVIKNLANKAKIDLEADLDVIEDRLIKDDSVVVVVVEVVQVMLIEGVRDPEGEEDVTKTPIPIGNSGDQEDKLY